MKAKLLCLLGLLFFTTPALMFAGSACATPTIVPADGRIVDFDFVAPSGTNFYQFNATSGRSYSVELRQDYDDVNTDLTTSLNSDAGTGCATAVAGTTDTHLVAPAMPSNATRLSFVASATQPFSIKVANSNATTGRYISISVSETTMYSANFFSGFGYQTAYTFVNTTGSAISGTLNLIDASNGAVDGTSTITLAAGAAALVDTVGGNHTNATAMNVTPGKTGSAVFTHNGPPGSVLAASFLQNLSANYVQAFDLKPLRQGR